MSAAPFTVPMMAHHVIVLCHEHGIELVTHERNYKGRAIRSKRGDGVRQVRIPPVRSAVTYALALHEIGHVVEPKANGRKYRRLNKEIAAWRWAVETARAWPWQCADKMQRCLDSYVRWAERRGFDVPRLELSALYAASRAAREEARS